MRKLIFPVALDKTVWATEWITFLGLLIDLRNKWVSIPTEKVVRAMNLIQGILQRRSKKMTVHEMQKLCGYLNYLCRCIVPGRAFTRRLYSYTAETHLLPHHHFKVNQEIRADLEMWEQFMRHPSVYCRPFIDFTCVRFATDLEWYTDASKNVKLGFGGIYRNNWFNQYWTDDDEVGNFIIDKDPSIQFLELYAVTVSVLLWSKHIQNSRICLFVDNESIRDMINNGSSGCKNCMTLIRIITLESMCKNCRIFAKHIRTDDNILADALSRFQMVRFYKEARRIGKSPDNLKEIMPSKIWPIRKIWRD